MRCTNIKFDTRTSLVNACLQYEMTTKIINDINSDNLQICILTINLILNFNFILIFTDVKTKKFGRQILFIMKIKNTNF